MVCIISTPWQAVLSTSARQNYCVLGLAFAACSPGPAWDVIDVFCILPPISASAILRQQTDSYSLNRTINECNHNLIKDLFKQWL
jgi:hypothetical protein